MPRDNYRSSAQLVLNMMTQSVFSMLMSLS
jgi:hypothetical protein